MIDGDVTVWDSLSIIEYVAERFPEARLWPEDRAHRAHARSISAEMHSGFSNVRNDLPMNIHVRVKPQDWKAETRAELARIDQIWAALRTRHASLGPWLFGKRTIADAFYAPVACRMRTYGVGLSTAAQS